MAIEIYISELTEAESRLAQEMVEAGVPQQDIEAITRVFLHTRDRGMFEVGRKMFVRGLMYANRASGAKTKKESNAIQREIVAVGQVMADVFGRTDVFYYSGMIALSKYLDSLSMGQKKASSWNEVR